MGRVEMQNPTSQPQPPLHPQAFPYPPSPPPPPPQVPALNNVVMHHPQPLLPPAQNTNVTGPYNSAPLGQSHVAPETVGGGVSSLQGAPTVLGQPGHGSGNYNAGIGTPWSTDLFACAEDPHNALITAIFPCITFGQLAEILDNGTTTCVTSGIVYAAAPCIQSRRYRTKLRQRFGLMEAPAADWIVHLAFEPCALCQEHRELVRRGIDPSIGFRGNLEKAQASQHKPIPMPMTPPQNQVMMTYNAAPPYL